MKLYWTELHNGMKTFQQFIEEREILRRAEKDPPPAIVPTNKGNLYSSITNKRKRAAEKGRLMQRDRRNKLKDTISRKRIVS